MSLGIFLFHHHILVAAYYKTEVSGMTAQLLTWSRAIPLVLLDLLFDISSQELCFPLLHSLCLQPSSPLSVFPFIFSPSFLFFSPLSYWPLLLALPHTTSFKSFFLDFPGSFLFLSFYPLSQCLSSSITSSFSLLLYFLICFFLPVSVFLSSCSHS